MIQLIKEDGTVYGPGSIQIIDKYGKPKIPVIPPSATVWGTITGTVTAQTDLTGYISSNYYPLVTNPSGFITSAALTPYLTSATAASTYYPLTNPSNYISGITSGMVTTALGYTAANQDGTILYHSIKWFTPSDTVSSSGTTVTSIGTQFLSTMVGSKLTISGESRIITVYTSTTQVTVNSAYSINYSGIAPASWGVYSKGLELGAANGLVTAYSGFQNGGAPAGSVIFTYSAGYITNDFGYKLSNNRCAFIYNTEGSNSWSINWSSTTSYGNTKDIGIKRNAAGVLEINNGIGTTGLLADRRDLLVRNVRASSLTLDLAPFTITGSNNTLQTASTAVVGINYLGGTRQWATGAIATQSEIVWGATTYSFVGASTITNAYGNVFNAPIAGTNCTILANWAAQFNGGVEVIGLKGLTITTPTSGVGNGAIKQGMSTGYTFTIDGANGSGPRLGLGSTPSSGYDFFEIGAFSSANNFATKDRNFRILTTISTVQDARFVLFANTGNLTLQNGGTFTDNGYRLEVVGTSKFTDRVNIGNYASPSAQRMFTVGQDTAWVTIGSLPGATNYGAIFFNQATPSINNAAIFATSGAVSIQATAQLYLRAGGANIALFEQNTITLTPYLFTSGAVTSFSLTKPNNTGQTLSTSIAGFNYVGGSRQWATGNITTQSENVWGATTYSFVGASTIATAFGNVFNAPIAGTNCTITANYAARFNGAIYSDSTNSSIFDNSAGSNYLRVRRTGGTIETILGATGSGSFVGSTTAHSMNIQSAGVTRLSFAGSGNGDCTLFDAMFFIFGSTTGNKLGTAITQKLAFWNATPIVQPANTTSLNGVLENTGLMASGSTISTINKPLVVGTNTTPRTGVATDGVTSVLGDLQNFTTNYHSGEVLYNELSGEAINFGQVCYRDRFGKWLKATAATATASSYNMLGICLHTVGAADTAVSILTRGYVETTYIAAGRSGDPLFMDATTAGSIVNAQPSAAGNVVRIIGNLFWANSIQTNGKWIIYFNPDNTWIEL